MHTTNDPKLPPRRLILGAGLSLGALLTLAACGGSTDDGNRVYVDGVRVKTTINKTGRYDVDITGTDCEVRIGAANTVDRLLITGFSNEVHVDDTAKIEVIDFAGRDNTVYVPKGFKTRRVNEGANNRIIER